MQSGTVNEAIDLLNKADEVLRSRIRMGYFVIGGESHSCEASRELIQKAITQLLPHDKGG